MKIRTDFVTNSSSSSFILAFNDKNDGEEKIKNLSRRYGSDYVSRLLMDFSSESPIKKDDIPAAIERDIENQAEWFLNFGDDPWWSKEDNTFKNTWMENHPDASYMDYYNSEEYKNAVLDKKNEYMDCVMDKIGQNDYVVILEYEDHDDIGSELEHEILPECDFTVRGFSHH